ETVAGRRPVYRALQLEALRVRAGAVGLLPPAQERDAAVQVVLGARDDRFFLRGPRVCPIDNGVVVPRAIYGVEQPAHRRVDRPNVLVRRHARAPPPASGANRSLARSGDRSGSARSTALQATRARSPRGTCRVNAFTSSSFCVQRRQASSA